MLDLITASFAVSFGIVTIVACLNVCCLLFDIAQHLNRIRNLHGHSRTFVIYL